MQRLTELSVRQGNDAVTAINVALTTPYDLTNWYWVRFNNNNQNQPPLAENKLDTMRVHIRVINNIRVSQGNPIPEILNGRKMDVAYDAVTVFITTMEEIARLQQGR